MTIECPFCAHRWEDRDRASLIGALGADTGAVELNTQQEATTQCPSCGEVVQFGLLMRGDDDVWRNSPFAGHADDVAVMRPPGGGVSYRPAPRDPDEGPHDPAHGRKLRRRRPYR
jgi:hypothetical protein